MKIFLSLFLVFISFLSLYTQVDASALEIYEETFNRAVYSFAIVKGLNALISVIQSTEINVSLFVGATIGVGEILDPINDLVERFSVVMLISSVAIGVQHLLLLLGKSIFIKVLLVLTLSFTVLGLWMKTVQTSKMFVFSLKLAALLLILRFGAVVFIYATQFIYQGVYSEQYESSNAYIKTYKDDLEVIQSNKENMDDLLVQLKNKTETFSKKVIQLITIFVVTTVLLPLVFMWLFVLLVKLLFNTKLDYDTIKNIINHKEIK